VLGSRHNPGETPRNPGKHGSVPVAQWIERPPPKRQVAGSTPARGTILLFANPLPPSAQPTHYRIVPLDPHAHLYEVRVTVDDPSPTGQRFMLPTWIPGSYLIREFARQFVTVRAESGDRAVPIAKTAKNVWQAAPCAGPLTVIAQVYAFDLSVRSAYLDATRGYFNGPSVFLLAEGREQAPCIVDVAPPGGAIESRWRVATTLASAGAPMYGFGLYRAESYDELIDHPVETSEFALATFEAGGVPHDVAISGQHTTDLPRLARDMQRVCQWQIDLFGGAPFARYLFQVTAVGDGYGGLEHRASTSLLCGRDELPHAGLDGIDDDYLHFLGLVSHEYFHAWNVKRITPAAFAPYDLSRENYTRQLWAFEGITSYYDDLALTRCGLISAERYCEVLARTITNVLRAPGRLMQSVADSSFDAWVKFYRPDENSPNAVVSYYAKGALIACALDLTLRREGRATLDDLMRALWERYGRRGIGVPEDGIPNLASELAGRDLSDFFARYVEGTEEPPLRELLADFGVTLHLRAANDAKDRGGKPAKGVAPGCTLGIRLGDAQKLAVVLRDGPAARAGLAAGDTLVAVGGLQASPERLATLLTQGAPGDVVAIHAFRRDELFEVSATLAQAPDDTCYFTLDPEPPPDVLARRDAWLLGQR
jgi:predicted metalloprotease with PDZ domain